MALFIPGMHCAISGKTIRRIEDAVLFPPFISNEADPLFIFSDAVVDRETFLKHPLAAEAQKRLEEGQARTAPDKRRCLICGELITHPDDYVGLGYLVSS